jgi:hypothetical protein
MGLITDPEGSNPVEDSGRQMGSMEKDERKRPSACPRHTLSIHSNSPLLCFHSLPRYTLDQPSSIASALIDETAPRPHIDIARRPVAPGPSVAPIGAEDLIYSHFEALLLIFAGSLSRFSNRGHI